MAGFKSKDSRSSYQEGRMIGCIYRLGVALVEAGDRSECKWYSQILKNSGYVIRDFAKKMPLS
jgi:hypothetical protein